jgi:hypothetical protein
VGAGPRHPPHTQNTSRNIRLTPTLHKLSDYITATYTYIHMARDTYRTPHGTAPATRRTPAGPRRATYLASASIGQHWPALPAGASQAARAPHYTLSPTPRPRPRHHAPRRTRAGQNRAARRHGRARQPPTAAAQPQGAAAHKGQSGPMKKAQEGRLAAEHEHTKLKNGTRQRTRGRAHRSRPSQLLRAQTQATRTRDPHDCA